MDFLKKKLYIMQPEGFVDTKGANKVWTLVDLPDDRQAIENKWIFERKTNTDSSVTMYKARIVAKGFRQVHCVDYDESFSLVSMLKSVRIMLAIAAFYEIWQMDKQNCIP